MRVLCALSVILALSHPSARASSSGFVDLPQNCFASQKYPCALRSLKGSLRFEQGSSSFSLGESSALKLIGPGQFQLLQGRLWVQKAEQQVLVLGPSNKMHFDGEIFIEKQKDGTTLVRNLDGEVRFQSPYLFQQEALPSGFQNWYGTINTQKQIQRGVIRPIEISPFLKSWLPVANLPPAEGRKHLLSFKEAWTGAVEASTEMYREVIERRMASQIELDQVRARSAKSAQEERARLRHLYRQKTGFAPESQ